MEFFCSESVAGISSADTRANPPFAILEAIPKLENGTKLMKILVVRNARNSHFQRENAIGTSMHLDHLPI
jgi:hypothetical protein